LPSLEIRNRQIPKLTGHWQLIRQAWVLYIDAHPSHEAADTDKPINSFLLAELLDFYFSLVSEQQKSDVPKAAPIRDQTGRISVELQGLRAVRCKFQAKVQTKTLMNVQTHLS